jgi:hypothetical protein
MESIVKSAEEKGSYDELSAYAMSSLAKMYERLGNSSIANVHAMAIKSSIKKILDL